MAQGAEIVTVRPAQPADLPACAAIINDVIDETPWLPRLKSRAEIAALFGPELLASRTLFVAEQGGAVRGYMSMTPEGRIPALYLVPGLRGLGIGARLLAEAKARHPGGLSLTVFEPNHDARRFYAREGFAEDPAGRDDAAEEGIPILFYRWKAAS